MKTLWLLSLSQRQKWTFRYFSRLARTDAGMQRFGFHLQKITWEEWLLTISATSSRPKNVPIGYHAILPSPCPMPLPHRHDVALLRPPARPKATRVTHLCTMVPFRLQGRDRPFRVDPLWVRTSGTHPRYRTPCIPLGLLRHPFGRLDLRLHVRHLEPRRQSIGSNHQPGFRLPSPGISLLLLVEADLLVRQLLTRCFSNYGEHQIREVLQLMKQADPAFDTTSWDTRARNRSHPVQVLIIVRAPGGMKCMNSKLHCIPMSHQVIQIKI